MGAVILLKNMLTTN